MSNKSIAGIQPLISIILPTYGRPSLLEKSIKSVLKQTYSNFEVIIVDDNSNYDLHKETLTIVNKFYSDHRIKYFHDKKNRGGSLARNKGIELSSGEYITFLDDDDTYHPEKLELQINHLIVENLDVSVCDMFFLSDGELQDVSNCYARVSSPTEFVLNGNSYTPMIMATKTALLEVGCFTDTSRYQDHVLMLKFFINNKKIKRLPKKLFTHNNHDGERITYTKKFESAYKIRNSFEELLTKELSKSEYKKYKLRDTLIRARIMSNNNKNYDAYLFALSSIKKITSFSDVIKIVKTILRITILKKQL